MEKEITFKEFLQLSKIQLTEIKEGWLSNYVHAQDCGDSIGWHSKVFKCENDTYCVVFTNWENGRLSAPVGKIFLCQNGKNEPDIITRFIKDEKISALNSTVYF